jgi:NADPH:quinone reductase-like Zn-dependent oxidoreductase
MSVSNQETMKSVVIAAHGTDVDKLLSITNQRPKPLLRTKGELLVQVHACALAPGDVRVLKGDCDFFQSPGEFPYIPGGDLAGVVAEADEDSRFHQGDQVMCMFELPRPLHGLAEYALVKESNAEIMPKSLDMIQASALTSSALAAMLAVEQFVKRGDCILVLGGSGGVSTFFVQLARNAGASYIACTSTQDELLTSLGVDRVIDYRTENWWEMAEYKEQPFDLILDTVGGREPWIHTLKTKTLKRKGYYVVMNGDEPLMKIHNSWQAMQFVYPLFSRQLWTSMWPFVPKYRWHANGLDIQPGRLQTLGKLVDEGKLKVVLDPMTPVPFETAAIQQAFKLMESRHAHGKVVVQIQ